MAAADARWQRTSKARRAAVYRMITLRTAFGGAARSGKAGPCGGRAARIAREDRDAELASDLRVVMDVLRAHAVAGARTANKPRRAKRRS